MVKNYKVLWAVSKDKVYNGFPNMCPDCTSDIEVNGDFDYANEWTISYTCVKCGHKFAYQPSDMGQTLPWLVRYDRKEEVYGKE